MKRLVAILFFLGFLALVEGCGGTSPSTSNEPAPAFDKKQMFKGPKAPEKTAQG